VDLGDSVYGPLDPGGTAAMLVEREVPSVRGNEDRAVLQPATGDDSATLLYTRSCLSESSLHWLAGLPLTSAPFPGLYCCHGSPQQDDERLLENVSSAGVTLKSSPVLAAQLAEVRQPVVLCGHSHLPHTVALPEGRLIVNPGSVGLPAYSDQTPVPHTMETGSPHARYAIVAKIGTEWRVEHVVVPYDWEGASEAAARNGREDWAAWLRTGRANLAP
jgi:diadenosine tetraphosphatase ApaH/serine/threonine PP2A family protein phosphatase